MGEHRIEVLDPRDLKYCRNQCSVEWRPEDDPFAWRDRLPFARWGLAELQIMGWPLLAVTLVVGWFWWYLAWIPAIPLILIVWFFRDSVTKNSRGARLAGFACRRKGLGDYESRT